MFLIKFIKPHRVALQQSVYLSAVQLSPSWRAVAKTVKSNHSSMRDVPDVTCAAHMVPTRQLSSRSVITTLTYVTYTFCLYLLGRSRLVSTPVSCSRLRPGDRLSRMLFVVFPSLCSQTPGQYLKFGHDHFLTHPFQLVHRSFHRLTLCTLNY
jgi:hypothetical protein